MTTQQDQDQQQQPQGSGQGQGQGQGFALDEPFAVAGGPVHDVVLEFVVSQDGAPFLESRTAYHHCSDPVAAFIVGQLVSMTATLGPKGGKPKSGPFNVEMKVSQDGSVVGSGNWTGLLREGILLFERQVLDIWVHMNTQGTLQAKAFGKI